MTYLRNFIVDSYDDVLSLLTREDRFSRTFAAHRVQQDKYVLYRCYLKHGDHFAKIIESLSIAKLLEDIYFSGKPFHIKTF